MQKNGHYKGCFVSADLCNPKESQEDKMNKKQSSFAIDIFTFDKDAYVISENESNLP